MYSASQGILQIYETIQIAPRLRTAICETSKVLSHLTIEPTILRAVGNGKVTAYPLHYPPKT